MSHRNAPLTYAGRPRLLRRSQRRPMRTSLPRPGCSGSACPSGWAGTGCTARLAWSPDRIRPIWAKCSASKTAPFLGGRTHVDDLVQSWASACQPTTWGGGCRWGMGSGEAALPRGEGAACIRC